MKVQQTQDFFQKCGYVKTISRDEESNERGLTPVSFRPLTATV